MVPASNIASDSTSKSAPVQQTSSNPTTTKSKNTTTSNNNQSNVKKVKSLEGFIIED